jgi:hypothetical protein
MDLRAHRPTRLLLGISLAMTAGALAAVADAAPVLTPALAHAAGPRPLFQSPFRCGETWLAETRSDHKPNPNSIDFNRRGDDAGQPILASYAGTVSFSGWNSGGGYMVNVNHGSGWGTSYLHMRQRPMVSVGQRVAQGQQLGQVGSTGQSTGPHLHYQQWMNTPSNTVRSGFNGVLVNVQVGKSQWITSHNCG